MMDSPTPDRRATVLVLLAIAGGVDAIGLAETGRYFVSYMSGNITQMGMLLAYRDYAGVLLPLGLVALFVAGATIGSLVAERAGGLAAAVLMLVEAALLLLAWQVFGSSRPAVGLIVLPVAMGLANIVTLRAGAPHPGTTYATGALVRLGIELAGLGRDTTPRDAGFHLCSALALLFGAMAGALLRLRFGAGVLLGPVVVLLLLATAEFLFSRRRAV